MFHGIKEFKASKSPIMLCQVYLQISQIKILLNINFIRYNKSIECESKLHRRRPFLNNSVSSLKQGGKTMLSQ